MIDEAPVFVIVSVWDTLFPSSTLPKPRLVGLAPRAPAGAPVPDNGMVSVGFDALDVTVTFPLAAPVAVGLNATLKVALCPAVSVTGTETPLTLKLVPLAAI